MNKKIVICLIACLMPCVLYAQSDSAKIEQMLIESLLLPKDSSRTLFFAQKLMGTPYGGPVVETNIDNSDEVPQERLVVSLSRLDCVTFVETVLALTLCNKDGKIDFASFKASIQRVRYRGGIIDGYASRLHYFSDWIADNAKRGVVREKTNKSSVAQSELLDLHFMTSEKDSYLPLKKDPVIAAQIAHFEKLISGTVIYYIPKFKLGLSKQSLQINDGDILAITTNKPGLDIVHVGFAYWIAGRLHMLHASSIKRRVILDPQNLYDYSQDKKSHKGLRVVEVL